MQINRRVLLGGLAALPFLKGPSWANAKDTLRIGLSAFPQNQTPWVDAGGAWKFLNFMLYRGLISYDNAGAVRGELAESWDRVDNHAWRFKLRDAKFHDGRKVTAADVKWSLEQIGKPETKGYMYSTFREIDGIETPDERTVVVRMKSPTSTMLTALANFGSGIVAAGSLDSRGWGVGAGPFRIAGVERGVSLQLVASEHFHRAGSPRFKTVQITAYSDENLRVAALNAGDVDLIDYVPWQSMDSIQANPNLSLYDSDGTFMHLMFNGTDASPFKDARIRRAVGHAIRREDIINSAFSGKGSPLEGLPIAPSSPFFDKERSKAWAYNPDRARQLLQEAGVPNGFKCVLLSTAQYGMHKNTAIVVQQHLAELGIQVELKLPDWSTRIVMGTKGQYDIAINGNGADNNDPDGLASIIDGELPPGFTRSFGLPTPEIHQLFVKGRSEFDQEKRREIYAELERKAIEVAPIIGLTWRSQAYGSTARLKGFASLPGALGFYSSLTLDGAHLE